MCNKNDKEIFNNFKLSDEEVLKVIEDYMPLILKKSYIGFKFDEDLCQEIKICIYQELSKNRRK
ncbi:MAG: hypothetical protein J6D03_10660 [Clostridia bacterium]|nr:hypothetical protein [Clostridia bacterium]